MFTIPPETPCMHLYFISGVLLQFIMFLPVLMSFRLDLVHSYNLIHVICV